MRKKSAIEIMVLNPDPDVHRYRKGVHENLWIKDRFGEDNYLSIGVMLKKGTSELQFYIYADCDTKPHPKFYSSLKELQEDLPEKKKIFDRTNKVYLMGHGDPESKYGFGNYHAHDNFNHPPDATEQIYDDKFDELIQDILRTIPAQNDEIGITLEVCHADNLVTAEKVSYTKSFLERLSEKYPRVTFSGTGPWSDSDDLQESLATGSRASGGYPNLNAPITSMGGGIWKHGNTVIFHHNDDQIAVRKSPFASTETAKNLKINTVNYACEILNQQTNLTDEEREKILTRIRANRKILNIEDLKYEPVESSNEKITKLVGNEKIILKQEQDSYLKRVHTILSQDEYSDRDVLMIALGLNHRFIFNGHDDMLQKVLANENLLKLVMVSCGKVLIGAQNNNSVIDLLVKRGISVNSVDEEGMTALHYAANNFYVYRAEPLNLVKKLLDCGANVEAVDKNGRTPLTLATEQSRKETVIAGKNLLELLEQRLFEQSLLNPAITSGRNANCFFQSFMHVLTRLPDKIVLQLLQDSQYKLSMQHLIENFNQAYSKLLPKPFNLKEIIELSRTLHPLDREFIFGPVLRATYNTLVKVKLIQTEPLGLGEHDIVLAHQTVAFANCFGARLSVYMTEKELNKAQTSGMPQEVADRVSKLKVEVADAIFVCDRQVDQPSIWEVNLVFAGVHLNYTHGTSELNQHEREQVIISQSTQGACFASAPLDSNSAPLFSANIDILAFRMVKLFRQFNSSKNLTEFLSTNTGLFRKLEDGFLEEHRHDDPKIQHEYDKRFGLILKQ